MIASRRSNSNARRVLHARIHVRLEEAIGATSVSLGSVHGQVRVLQQLIRVSTIVRSQGDADAGVGGELVATSFTRLSESLVDSRHQINNVNWILHTGLNDRKLVSTQSGNDIGLSETAAQTRSRRFQQFITDRVPECVVDGLEMIEVEIEHC